jgi:hypothetical protein
MDANLRANVCMTKQAIKHADKIPLAFPGLPHADRIIIARIAASLSHRKIAGETRQFFVD